MPATEPPPTRSARKRGAIVDAARTTFLRKGYGGTTMDEVAALAAVSKQTVYKHFADKKGLFTAIVTGEIDDAERLTHDMVAALAASDDIAADLRRFARRHVADVMQPDLVRLRRIVIAEAEQFPELARAWFASGPERAHATLAEQFDQLAERGLLHLDDPLLAAQQFNWLVLAIPLNDAMFHPGAAPPAEELERQADAGVRVFLAAYGTGA
jgi:TetR/AcrR family transcriptional regulator, mexJK operon transcriptional repressor